MQGIQGDRSINGIRVENKYYKNLFFMKALPDPDLRYFSNAKALYLSLKAQ